MVATLLLYAAALMVALWGTMHLVKTKPVVAGFEPLSADNRYVLTMEWVLEGVTLCFICDDAVAFYREIRSQGIGASEPQVGNGMWVTQLQDPDGYRLLFESSTEAAEGTRLSQLA